MHVVEKEASSTVLVCPCTTHLRISVSCTKGENARCLCHVRCVVMRHCMVTAVKSSALARMSESHSARSHFQWKACFMYPIDQGDHAIVTTPVTHPHPSYKLACMLAALLQVQRPEDLLIKYAVHKHKHVHTARWHLTCTICTSAAQSNVKQPSMQAALLPRLLQGLALPAPLRP